MFNNDDEKTPRDRHTRGEGLEIRWPPAPTPTNASNHPTVKIARVWHVTAVTVVAEVVIGVLAALQQWPYAVSLGALGAATGLWAFGALKR